MLKSKKNPLKGLLGSSSIYLFTSILNAAIPFLLLPVITRYLSPDEYGIYSMFKVVSGISFSIIGLGINGAITRVYYKKSKEELGVYITNSFLLVTLSSILLLITFLILPNFFSNITAIPSNWLWSVIFVSYGKVIFQATLVLYQVENRPVTYGVFQIIQTLLNFGLSLLFIISLNLNWQGAILGETIAFFSFGIIGLILIKKNNLLIFQIKKDDIKHALKFGLPILPHVIGMYIITASDRFLITNMIGVTETGIYAVGYQIAMIIMVLQDSFNKAWVPWLFSNLSNKTVGIKFKIVKITYLYFLVIIILALMLSLIAPWIVNVFIGSGYESASEIVSWLALGYAFNGMYKMVTNYIFYVEKTYYLAIVTFITAVLNVFLSYILIKLNGFVGAAQGTMISYLISFLLTWIVSNKLFKMPWFYWIKGKSKKEI